jgi:hypothetical protein
MMRFPHDRQTQMRLIGWALACTVAALACSGSTGGNETRATASDNPVNNACLLEDCEVIGHRVPQQPSPICPLSKPSVSQACDTEGLLCSYGSSLTAYCREYLECVGQRWSAPAALKYGTECISQPEGFCPSAPQAGASCVTGDVDSYVPCEYERGVACYCFGNPPRVSGAPGMWFCYGPPPNGNCPELLPNLGDGCMRTGQFCGYGSAQQECHAPYANVFCRQEAWEDGGGACLD